MIGSSKFAGGLLALSALLWIFMIAAWPFLIGPRESASTDEMTLVVERAAHLLDKQAFYRGIWIVEALGAMGTAIAGLILIHRQETNDGIAPIGWASVGVGSIVYVAMYGVMLGSYWPAAQAATNNPAILAAAITGAMSLFYLSNIALNAGFTLTFIAEARCPHLAIPQWLAWFGAVLSALALAATSFGLFAAPTVSSVGSLDATALIAVVHFAAIAVFGFGISRAPRH
ncbi:hypothetical protein [Aurantiacibacter flavus]|uniref:DUF4386 family protein n=1 Tax=Aurantiacibacter flavus TaxID=3145232 RepID=A0ABV0D100_9SPHN